MGRKATPALLAALGLLFAAEFCFSLRWRMEQDSPIMLYLAWAIDRRHLVAYRDLFDVNTPATYALYALVGRIFGYGDLGFRIADLTVLTAILATMWFWMRRFGATCAWCAVFCFGLLFLRLGVQGGLQRDFVLILPASASIPVAAGPWRVVPKAFALGLLFGLAAAVKPQAAIGLPAALWFCLRYYPPGKSRAAWPAVVGASLAGLALPLLATGVYLLRVGGLGSFLDMARNYWPLFAKLASNTHAVAGPAGMLVRGLFLLHGIASLGPYAVWSLAGVAGVLTTSARADLPERDARLAWLIGTMAAAYAVYPAFAGEFWDYHWLPFTFFAVAAGSLCLARQGEPWPRAVRLLPVLMLVMAVLITIRPPAVFLNQLTGHGANVPKGGRVDAIASYLTAHLRPGDTVQPLDWTGGAVHAMLIAHAMPATRFIYDVHFYHGVSEPYIQDLRKEFVARLAASRPRFIVEIVGPGKPWVSGMDTTRSFPALRRLIRSRYVPVQRGSDYVIYEIRH